MLDLLTGILIGMGLSTAAFALMLYLYPRLVRHG